MPRPSMKDQRVEEILDAFERLIARIGLHACSLEVIAEEAGMKRSILRHYIGNRDQIVEALAGRVIARYESETDELLKYLPKQGQAEALVDLLFYGAKEATIESIAVNDAIASVSTSNENIRKLYCRWLDQFIETLSSVLHQAHPDRDPKQCWAVAYGIASIYFSHESMTPMDLPAKFEKAAKANAMALVETLTV